MSNSLSETPQKGWFGRNWLWVVPLGCLTPILLCGGGILSIALFFVGTLKTSDVYKEAVAAAAKDPEVTKRLGEPIAGGFWAMGFVEINNAAGDADLVIPIAGPRGSAMIHAGAKKANGKWTYSKLEVMFEGATNPYDLLPKSGMPKADQGATKAKPKASP